MFWVSFFFFKVYLDYVQGEKLSRKMYIKIDYLSKQQLCLDRCFLSVTLAAASFLNTEQRATRIFELSTYK